MKANKDTVLVGTKVILVPYEPQHVPKYNDWMQDERLRELTASEPLTLEEEYNMQRTWQSDEDKLTFIILARVPGDGLDHLVIPTDQNIIDDAPKPPGPIIIPSDSRLASLPMIGDVNIFFKGSIPEPPSQVNDEDEDAEFECELEIMIAEPGYRRKGLAQEALQLMLRYATGYPSCVFRPGVGTLNPPIPPGLIPNLKPSLPIVVHPSSLLTRISETNTPSISLFQKMGFSITKRVEVFGEVEMRWGR